MNLAKFVPSALLGTLFLGLSASASETVRYSSGGFEAPGFTPGVLAGSTLFDGQDGWLATGAGSQNPDLSAITVQSQIVHSGNQAVRVDATNQPSPYMHLRRNVVFGVDGPEHIVDVRLDMYIASTPTTPSEWMMQTQGGPGPQSGIQEWWIDTTNVLHMTDTSGDVNTGFVVTRDQWHHFITRIDYNAQTVEVLVDGQSVGIVNALSGINLGLYGFSSIMFNQPGDDQMVFDNFEVVTHDGQPGIGNLTSFCEGDGSGSACPCNNQGQGGAGCMNSTGQGAVLSASGSTSVTQDDLSLRADQLPASTPALLFFGDNQLATPSFLGDGLRCAGGQIQRVGVLTSDASGSAQWGTGLAGGFGFSSGDVRGFQVWYRDSSSPCGSGFNLSNGIEAVFTP